MSNSKIAAAGQGKRIAKLAVSIAACIAFGTTMAAAKGGTAKPPNPKNPPPPVGVLPAPNPLTRLTPATVRTLTPPTAAADANIHGFDVTGFVQSYDASAACAGGGSGGNVTINGTKIVIPCNLVVQMPANTVTWADFVTGLEGQVSPEPYDLASITSTSQNPSFELHLIGNVVNGTYIAALGYASQQSVNSGTGVISSIDFSTGHIVVASNSGTTVELEINDPKGRFGRATSRDGRLSVDDANPTIVAATGYPMCVPRTSNGQNDPLCPQKNRPSSVAGCRDFITGLGLTPATGGAGVFFNNGANGGPAPGGGVYCTSFVMKAPLGTVPDPTSHYPPPSAIATATEPDAMQQAPFEPGDHITWNGSLMRGVTGANGSDVISVHTITADVGIFTQPGTLPVYLHMGEFGVAGDINAAGLSIAGIPEEVQNRLVVEADVTDITSIVDVYLVDEDASGSGFEIQRWVTPLNMTGRTNAGLDSAKARPTGFQGGGVVPGATGVVYPKPAGFGIEGGIVTQWDGAQISRARIRASKATPGLLTSPTRTIRVVARSLCTPADINPTTGVSFAGVTIASLGWTPMNTTAPTTPGFTSDGTCVGRAIAANGLATGEYLAPVFEFIFPENTGRGDPIVSNNFWDLNFLSGDAAAPNPLVPQPW
ncbi:hypothetical protein [Hyphomicrobium sp. 99]|uniref:hypothetical protein n=1 Tax=Hyphomicrobium sp. 99 TaxID=1163419 RepID=UPI0005F813C2|nr:hypothetical protein [Hyphomicrobium sp. 99]